ncbi:hypothetical protein CDD82_4428 [Ophiocordyceps australis]|uniref:Helicase ATP-binding domain-containing protein n=1 Tax=Ophiocordyceps australis TaxID=1399860 RepID=A0A2C5ZSV4_9HYPO|nr:hypothetical protein CDD82_4428 [Ophiocordyceps australis]
MRPTSQSQLSRASTLATKLTLRDYQLECIRSVIASLGRGHKRVGISLATGSGKTVIFTQLIDQVGPRFDGKGDRTLILAHRCELVEQAARQCQLAYPDKTIDIEMGSLHASGTADITVASVRSITSRDRLAKYDPAAFKLVLVDEAHHIVASSYLRTLKHFGLDQKQAESPTLVGVSATFSRFDGLKLGTAIDEIVYHKDYIDMIEDKWLADVMLTTVESKANLSKVRSNASGDFQTGDLSNVVNTEEVNEIAVRSWIAKASDRKSTLVFCVDLAHVAGLTQKFREYGFDARSVTGDTPKLQRSCTLDAFKAGHYPILVNCGVFTEGTDIPNIDCIVISRPTRSRNLLVQMIGRGMRLHPGKQNCHIIDIVSSLETGIITTPTLFGLDPNLLVDKVSVTKIKDQKFQDSPDQQQASRTDSTIASNSPIIFTEYSSVLDLIADTSGEKHIRAISQNAWIQSAPDSYVLSAPSGSYIRLERIQEEAITKPTAWYRAVEVRALPPGLCKSPFAARREILTAATFEDAVHGADRYAADAFPYTFINRHQPWRSLPATQGQLNFINKIRGKAEPLIAAELTKGRAADMITKIKHGARGQFNKIEAEQRRRLRQASMMDARRNREVVRVGPVAA